MDNFDERGYIVVYKKSGALLGYISRIDYSTREYWLTDDVNCNCKRYMQEDLLFHDLMFLQGYCSDGNTVFSHKMPYGFC